MSLIHQYINSREPSALSFADLDNLIRERSPRARADVARKIARHFGEGRFKDNEKQIAFDIFRLLVKDVEMRVRQAFAEELHANLEVPHDIVYRLASDVAEVAEKVLEHSYVLTEEDLQEIVRATKSTRKLCAIARRPSISVSLAKTLMDTAQEEVMGVLFGNPCANLPEEYLLHYVKELDQESTLLETLVKRGGLSMHVVETLFTLVGDALREHLHEAYRLPRLTVNRAMDAAREWSVLGVLENTRGEKDVQSFINALFEKGELSSSMIIRSLCTGDMRFFEYAMAKLTGIPLTNARLLLLDSGRKGFKAMYTAAGLPESFYDAVEILHKTAMDETQFGMFEREDFRQRVVGRIIREGYDRHVPEMTTLIQLIGGAGHGTASVH